MYRSLQGVTLMCGCRVVVWLVSTEDENYIDPDRGEMREPCVDHGGSTFYPLNKLPIQPGTHTSRRHSHVQEYLIRKRDEQNGI